MLTNMYFKELVTSIDNYWCYNTIFYDMVQYSMVDFNNVSYKYFASIFNVKKQQTE
jgi:hypothetical protein